MTDTLILGIGMTLIGWLGAIKWLNQKESVRKYLCLFGSTSCCILGMIKIMYSL